MEGKPVSYIDGFVIPVPTANKASFIDHARKSDAVFLEHGALVVGAHAVADLDAADIVD